MNDDQITSIAREYGEYVANSLDFDMCSDPELRHKLVVKGYSEAAQSVLEWLLRRFCLVEKEAIRKEYEMVKKIWEQVTLVDAKTFNEGRISEIEFLFPKIAKEVEG